MQKGSNISTPTPSREIAKAPKSHSQIYEKMRTSLEKRQSDGTCLTSTKI